MLQNATKDKNNVAKHFFRKRLSGSTIHSAMVSNVAAIATSENFICILPSMACLYVSIYINTQIYIFA